MQPQLPFSSLFKVSSHSQPWSFPGTVSEAQASAPSTPPPHTGSCRKLSFCTAPSQGRRSSPDSFLSLFFFFLLSWLVMWRFSGPSRNLRSSAFSCSRCSVRIVSLIDVFHVYICLYTLYLKCSLALAILIIDHTCL